MTKRCSRCAASKPRTEFYNCSSSRDKLAYWCRMCMRTYAKEQVSTLEGKRHLRGVKIKRAYGITLKEFDEMLTAQGMCCAICKTDKPRGRCNQWHIDHDHATGKVRGILCTACNRAIGIFRDDPDVVWAAYAYLTGLSKLHSGIDRPAAINLPAWSR